MSVVGAATPDHPPLGGFGPRMERFARDFVHAAVFNMGYGVAEASNGSAAFSDKHKIREERRLSPMSNTEVVPVDNLAVRPNKLRERLFTVGYLTSCAVAMIGWLIALAWAALQLVNWLIF